MPQYNRAELGRMGTESGFVRDTFEKVLRLKEILKFLNEDKFLREHLVLKGGTAINLTVFNLPRLSVDIRAVPEVLLTVHSTIVLKKEKESCHKQVLKG